MIRIIVPIVILLLLLFGGAAWLLPSYLGAPDEAGPPASTSPSTAKNETSPATAPEATGKSESPIASGGEQQSGFDVARIDPKGTSVFAGRADPNASVTILADGQPIGTTRADENGEWTFSTEHPFANADPQLSLKTGPAAAPSAEPPSQAKVASDAQRQEPEREQKPDGERTAKAVTKNLLKNLEGMVAEARKSEGPTAPADQGPQASAHQQQPAPAAPSTQQTAEATPPKNPEPKLPQVVAPSSSPPVTMAPSSLSPAASPPAKTAAAEPPKPAGPAPAPETKSVPVPIMFVYNEATFTPDGKKAASLLLEYLQLKRFGKVRLTGHADERGSDEFNMDLSRERLDAVAKYLRENGFKGDLDLIPKGKSEPFTGVARNQYPLEELYQLDRRVELVVAR